MAVPNEVPLVDYVGNGTTTEFNVPFQYETPSTLFISVNGVNPSTSDYLFNPDTGNFVFYTAPADGAKIRITRDTPEERDTDYDDNYNTFRPRTLNKDFDRLWRAIQEHLITINLNKDGLAQEILDRIQADEDMLDYIMNQDNAIKQDYIQRDNRIEQESKDRDVGLKGYIDQMIALVTGDPSFNGITTDFVTEDGETQRQKNDKVKRGIGNIYDSSLSYDVGNRVLLDDGTEVISTIASNTNDPNVDMTGWDFAEKTVGTVQDLLLISPVRDGLEVRVADSLQGGLFVYDGSRSAENDGGTVFNGWVRKYVLFATPKMFGIQPNDSTGAYGTKLNALFNCDFPVLLGKEKYHSDTPIVINNKNLSLQGVSKLESRIVFKNSGHGIVQNTATGTHTFAINNCSITTAQNGTDNGSGFKYDASAYIATLAITGTGYKVLGNRTLNRGQIGNVDFGSSDDSESPKGWKHALEFLGAMNFSVNGLHMRLPTDKSGNGVWIHGDGMPTDFHFNDVYSFWGNKVFRFNDYLEGFHLTNFELVNCNEGVSNEADSDTVVTSSVKMLASYISSGHVLAYKNCISSQWMSSSKMYGLELYAWGDSSISSVTQGINVVTCDAVQIYGSTIVNANPSANNTLLGIQLGTGWGNSVSDVVFKGQPWYAAVALGTNNTFYGNTVKDITVDKSDNAILVNESNCSGNNIEAPTIVTSTNLALSLSANVISKNNISFRSSVFNASYSHSTDTTFTVDISGAKLTQVPVSINVSEVAGVFGGIQYSYRRDVSTKDLITIQTTATVTSPGGSSRGLFIEVFGV